MTPNPTLARWLSVLRRLADANRIAAADHDWHAAGNPMGGARLVADADSLAEIAEHLQRHPPAPPVSTRDADPPRAPAGPRTP